MRRRSRTVTGQVARTRHAALGFILLCAAALTCPNPARSEDGRPEDRNAVPDAIVPAPSGSDPSTPTLSVPDPSVPTPSGSATTGSERVPDPSGPEISSAHAPVDSPAALATTEAPIFQLPDELPSVLDVKDPIFALLIGLVEGDLYGTLDQRHLQNELDRRRVKSKLPYEHVLDVTRLPVNRERKVSEVNVRFDGPLKLPIPYSVLGYNPGSLRATEECRFLEWKLGDVEVLYQKKEGDKYVDIPVPLQDVYLYGVTAGRLDLDIDAWVDKVMGGNLDDTGIVALMLCRYEGVWHGWAMGYNKDKKGRSGALDFRADSIVFPSPDGFKAIGRKMRSRAEAMLQQAAADVRSDR